jgi:hypothetical protein
MHLHEWLNNEYLSVNKFFRKRPEVLIVCVSIMILCGFCIVFGVLCSTGMRCSPYADFILLIFGITVFITGLILFVIPYMIGFCLNTCCPYKPKPIIINI